MKTVVIFSSKYGSTEKYAALIAGELGADLRKASEIKPSRLREYDAVIFGGGLYAGSIRGAGFVKKNAEALKGKRLAIFTVGMSNPTDKKYYQRIIDRNFDAGIRINSRFFHLRGGLDLAALSPPHRLIIGALKAASSLGKSKNADSDMLKALDGTDFFDKSGIAPIVEYISAP